MLWFSVHHHNWMGTGDGGGGCSCLPWFHNLGGGGKNLRTFSGSKYSRSMGARPKLPVSVTTNDSNMSQRVFTGTEQPPPPGPARTHSTARDFSPRHRSVWSVNLRGAAEPAGRDILSLNASLSDVAAHHTSCGGAHSQRRAGSSACCATGLPSVH